jgi:hypothetical protein
MSRNIRVEFIKFLEEKDLYVEFAENVKVYGERASHPELQARLTGCSTVLDVMMQCKTCPEEYVASGFEWATDRRMWEDVDAEWRGLCKEN